jgi:hypothetical protein
MCLENTLNNSLLPHCVSKPPGTNVISSRILALPDFYRAQIKQFEEKLVVEKQSGRYKVRTDLAKLRLFAFARQDSRCCCCRCRLLRP